MVYCHRNGRGVRWESPVAACLVIASGALRKTSVKPDAGIFLLSLLFGWMIFQILPLPPAWVAILSPEIWSVAAAARAATGQNLNAWLPISSAPALTFERILYVVPAMAAFVAVREIGARPGRRMWRVLSPLVAIASIEAVLGLLQFTGSNRQEPLRVSGTYVNPNHFAGLLEMAFPLGIAWAAARWKRGRAHRAFPGSIALANRRELLGASVLC